MSELESDRESLISEASENGKRTPAGKKAGRTTKTRPGESTKSLRKGPVESAPGAKVQAKSYSAAEGRTFIHGCSQSRLSNINLLILQYFPGEW